MSIKQREFIEAAELLDLGRGYIIFKEVMPLVLPYVVVTFFDSMRANINASVGLIFIGVIPFNPTHWGVMLNMAYSTGAILLPQATFFVLTPILFLFLLQFSLFNLARILDEILNPALRKEWLQV